MDGLQEVVNSMQKCMETNCKECMYKKDEGDCMRNLLFHASNMLVGLKSENRALRTELEVNRISVKKEETDGPDQTAKQDNGKLNPTLVPPELIWAVAEIRKIGTAKYHNDPDNWKRVEKERFRAAAYRHFLRYLQDPQKLDDESGLPNLWHCCCNLAFLCAMEKYDIEGCTW